MKNFKRIVSILLIIALLVSLSSVLLSCNKKETEDTSVKERQVAVSNVEEAIISGLNSDWDGISTNEDISKLQDAGDYVVTSKWVNFVGDTLYSSSLQTSKINALYDVLVSEEGRLILSDFTENVSSLITLVKKIGFTSSDISDLTYNFVYSVVDCGENLYNNVVSDLNDIKVTYAPTDPTIVANIEKAITSSTTIIDALPKNRETILNSLLDAKQAIYDLSAFVFNMSIDSVTENIFKAFFDEEGVLENITETEIGTLVDTLLLNVSSLKESMTEDQIAKLNTALSLIVDNFNASNISSVLYLQVVKYAKYAYMLVDAIPTMCDLVLSLRDTISNSTFISDLKTFATCIQGNNENARNINLAILGAKLELAILNTHTKQELTKIIEDICLEPNDYQKGMIVITIDFIANLTDENILNNTATTLTHPELMRTDDFVQITSLSLLFGSFYNAFIESYYDYSMGDGELSKVYTLSQLCAFDSFLEEGQKNPYNYSTETKDWYNYYVTTGLSAVKSKVAIYNPIAVNDLKEFVNDAYKTDARTTANVNIVANWDFVSGEIDNETFENTYKSTIYASGLGAIMIISTII